MKSANIILSNTYLAGFYKIIDQIKQKVDSDKFSDIILVVPDKFSLNAEQIFMEKIGLSSVFNVWLTTFSRLIAKGYKVAKVVKEVGSGLNDNRPKLQALLVDNTIDIIVVEHKDRLARFGLNYIEQLLKLDNRQIEVVNNVESETDDLMQDFVSIITSFCARLYGKRHTKRRTEQLIKQLQEDSE